VPRDFSDVLAQVEVFHHQWQHAHARMHTLVCGCCQELQVPAFNI
jgi:hypothetical protein